MAAQDLVQDDSEHGAGRERRIKEKAQVVGDIGKKRGQDVQAQTEDEGNADDKSFFAVDARSRDYLDAGHQHETGDEDKDGTHDWGGHDGE